MEIVFQETTEIVFPEKIQLSGFGFWHQGWNNTMEKDKQLEDGSWTYVMKSYNLYGLISIRPMFLKKEKSGQWFMTLDYEDSVWCFANQIGPNDDKIQSVHDPPFYGEWQTNNAGKKLKFFVGPARKMQFPWKK